MYNRRKKSDCVTFKNACVRGHGIRPVERNNKYYNNRVFFFAAYFLLGTAPSHLNGHLNSSSTTQNPLGTLAG